MRPDRAGTLGVVVHLSELTSAGCRVALVLAVACPLGVAGAAQAVEVAGRPTTTRVSVTSSGAQVAGSSAAEGVSADGRTVAFVTAAALVPRDRNGVDDVYVRTSGGPGPHVRRVSVAPDGRSDAGGSDASLSADGRYVAFRSRSRGLVPGPRTQRAGLYVHDLRTGTNTQVDLTPDGSQGDRAPAPGAELSADGAHVVFASVADDLVAGDTDNTLDVFVRDLRAGTTALVSQRAAGGPSRSGGSLGDVSADGRYVAFTSAGDDIVPGDTNGTADVFRRDMLTGTTVRISSTTDGGQIEPSRGASAPSISDDGQVVSYVHLGVGVQVWNGATGTTRLASHTPAGTPGNLWSEDPSTSGDGSVVVFASPADDLVPADTNGQRDVFAYSVASERVRRVSLAATGGQGDSDSYGGLAGRTGRYVVFTSRSSDLVPGDTNGTDDAFLRDRAATAD